MSSEAAAILTPAVRLRPPPNRPKTRRFRGRLRTGHGPQQRACATAPSTTTKQS